MERKKITLFEGLFAVVVILLIGIATTFYQPMHVENLRNIYSITFYVLEILLFLMFLLYYFKTNSFPEVFKNLGVKSIEQVFILTNVLFLLAMFSPVVDNFIWTGQFEYFMIEFELYLYLIFILPVNIIIFVLTFMIDINGTEGIQFRFTWNIKMLGWMLVYGFSILFFMAFTVLMIGLHYPTSAFWFSLNCLLLLNLFTCRMLNV